MGNIKNIAKKTRKTWAAGTLSILCYVIISLDNAIWYVPVHSYVA